MKICAVICEYNPFHLGHRHQLSEMRERGAVIAVMSGSFTQRGDAALISKYERAEAAVACGADLVLELPFPYSASPAERFAAAGVDIVDALGCVDELCFGSESGETLRLVAAAENSMRADFREALAARLAAGHEIPWRAAFAEVYAERFGETVFDGSNDILAVSYIRRLIEKNSAVRPVALRRIGEHYNGGGSEEFLSASSIRGLLARGDLEDALRAVPPAMARKLREAVETGRLAKSRLLYPLFASLMRSGRTANVPDVPEELASRMADAALHARDMEEFLASATTKRYSASRVRRALLYMLLNVSDADIAGVAYTTVLAANARGRELLATMRKTAKIRVVTKPADALIEKENENVARAASLAARADSIWELLCGNPRDGAAMVRERPRIENT